MFEGQHLTAEEQALLKELKQRERENVGDDHVLASPTDFIDMDDEDDYEEDEEDEDDHHVLQQPKMCDAEIQPEPAAPIHQQILEDDSQEDDEDVKSLQLLLQQSKGFYTTNPDEDDEDAYDFDWYDLLEEEEQKHHQETIQQFKQRYLLQHMDEKALSDQQIQELFEQEQAKKRSGRLVVGQRKTV